MKKAYTKMVSGTFLCRLRRCRKHKFLLLILFINKKGRGHRGKDSLWESDRRHALRALTVGFPYKIDERSEWVLHTHICVYKIEIKIIFFQQIKKYKQTKNEHN